LAGADDSGDGGVQVHVHDRGELHVHINGAIPVSTIQDIMVDEGTPLPAGFDLHRDMTRLAPCKSLAEYLTPWQVLRLFPKKRANLDRLANAVLGSLAENAVRFVELRSSVIYLTGLQSCTPAQAVERLIESTGRAAQHHGIQRGLILTVTRSDYGASNLCTLLQAYEDLGRPKDVVGLDLAGDEEVPYSAELPATSAMRRIATASASRSTLERLAGRRTCARPLSCSTPIESDTAPPLAKTRTCSTCWPTRVSALRSARSATD
jgi:adenosine deaminase